MIPLLLLLAALAGSAQTGPTQPVEPRRDTIVVTGSFEPVPLEEADRAVSSLEVEDRKLLANTVVDFLQLDPSLDVRRRAPDGIQSDLSIRGGTFGQTLILLDGIRLNDAQSGHHNMDFPAPLEALSRIEVLKGSGSTLYGSDAVGGVVNFITRRPAVSGFRLRTAAGNFGINQQRGSLSVISGRVIQRLTFSRDFSSGFAPNRDYRNLSLASGSDFSSRLGDTNLLLAWSDRPFGADRFYGDFNSWERTKTWFASLRQALGPKTAASISFRRHTDLFVLYRDRPEVFTNRHAVESWNLALRRREDVGRNATLHYGAEGYRDAIMSNNLGMHARGRGAAYAALDVRALRRFSFSLGAREEVYRSFSGQFSPTAAAGVWLSNRLKLRASASRAFRLPSYTDLYYHDPANRGTPGLRPEKAWSYDAGLDWNSGGRLRCDVTVFHRRERDGIDYVRSSPSDVWRAANIQRLRFTGVETGLGAGVSAHHRLELRYSALHGASAALAGLASRYVFNYPSHAAVGSWNGLLPGGLAARTRIGVTQRLNRDPYLIADFYAARSAGRLRPFLQLTNLSNTSYQEIAGIPMPGRGVIGGVEWVVFAGGK